MAEVVERKVT